jgi:hypothetical protein
MRLTLLTICLFFACHSQAQEERDTVMKRCPVYITDTVSANNFFLEFQPSTVKVYRVKGDLFIQIQQKDQFFTIFFNDKHLSNGTKFKIYPGARKKNAVEAKYSFRSGGTASFVNVANGTVETIFDKEKDLWHIKVLGMLANLVERSVTWYRVRADFWIK